MTFVLPSISYLKAFLAGVSGLLNGRRVLFIQYTKKSINVTDNYRKITLIPAIGIS